MSKKSVIILISCVAAVTAAVAAVIVFHTRIAELFASVLARLQKPAPAPGPAFTPEERESFADI